jgi:hypothetical protein
VSGFQFPAQALGCAPQIGGKVLIPPYTGPLGPWIWYGDGSGVGSAPAGTASSMFKVNRVPSASSFMAGSSHLSLTSPGPVHAGAGAFRDLREVLGGWIGKCAKRIRAHTVPTICPELRLTPVNYCDAVSAGQAWLGP